MIGKYIVTDDSGRELSYAYTLAAARTAVRVHLISDGEQGPLYITASDGTKIGTADLDDCGRVVIRTSTLDRAYGDAESEVINRWGRPE